MWRAGFPLPFLVSLTPVPHCPSLLAQRIRLHKQCNDAVGFESYIYASSPETGSKVQHGSALRKDLLGWYECGVTDKHDCGYDQCAVINRLFEGPSAPFKWKENESHYERYKFIADVDGCVLQLQHRPAQDFTLNAPLRLQLWLEWPLPRALDDGPFSPFIALVALSRLTRVVAGLARFQSDRVSRVLFGFDRAILPLCVRSVGPLSLPAN